MQFLYEQEVAGATLIRPNKASEITISAMASHAGICQSGSNSLTLPNVVEAILPALCDLVSDGLVEVQETTIVKAAKQAGAV